MIRQTVIRTMAIVDLRQDTLIAEMTGGKVSVTATKVGVMRLGNLVTPPGSRVTLLGSRVTPPGSRVTPSGSRVTPPGNSGAVGALAVMSVPRNVWLRAPVVAPPAGV